MRTAGERKKILEKRLTSVQKDLEDNWEKYDNLNINIRNYEIFKLKERLNQFN